MVILSGGDASRLEYPYPKGLFNMPLENRPSTLFSMIFERLQSLENLANKIFGKTDQKTPEKYSKMSIYVLVSKKFQTITKNYFEQNNNFGFTNIFFIDCESKICSFDKEGQILLKDSSTVLKTSFGNGDLMDVLLNEIYENMEQRGLEYLHISGIDNLLNRPLDPLFMGLMQQENLMLVHKIVEKEVASENVGLFVRERETGATQVMEYTYFPAHLKEKTVDNKLKYRNANMLNLCANIRFLEYFRGRCRVINGKYDSTPFLNKINYTWRNYEVFDPKTKQMVYSKCLKMERFFLDCFPLLDSAKQGFITVKRQDEFAPIKSVKGKDTPLNAFKMFRNFSDRILQNRKIINETKLESPNDLSSKKTYLKVFEAGKKSSNNEVFVGKFISDEDFYQIVLNEEGLLSGKK